MSETEAGRILKDVITTRRSVRQFTKAKVDVERLASLVTLGTWAPTGGNAQTWRFVIVTDEPTVRAIHAVSPGISLPPPAILVICQDLKRAEELGGAMGRDRCTPMDTAMAAQTIMLAAHAEGLGTCAVLSFHAGAVHKILGLPDEIRPQLLISVGEPAKVPPPPPRTSEGVLHLDRWGRPYNDRVSGPKDASDSRGEGMKGDPT
jgi:nitroreductase